jgi:hypothetical protein
MILNWVLTNQGIGATLTTLRGALRAMVMGTPRKNSESERVPQPKACGARDGITASTAQSTTAPLAHPSQSLTPLHSPPIFNGERHGVRQEFPGFEETLAGPGRAHPFARKPGGEPAGLGARREASEGFRAHVNQWVAGSNPARGGCGVEGCGFDSWQGHITIRSRVQILLGHPSCTQRVKKGVTIRCPGGGLPRFQAAERPRAANGSELRSDEEGLCLPFKTRNGRVRPRRRSAVARRVQFLIPRIEARTANDFSGPNFNGNCSLGRDGGRSTPRVVGQFGGAPCAGDVLRRVVRKAQADDELRYKENRGTCSESLEVR